MASTRSNPARSNQQTSRVQVLIDHLAPVPGIGYPSGGAPNASGWSSKNPLPVSIVPLDPTGSGSGVNTVIYSATGANPIGQKSAPEPAVGAPPDHGNLHARRANRRVSTRHRPGR